MEAMSSVYPFVYVCVQQHYSGNCSLMILYIEKLQNNLQYYFLNHLIKKDYHLPKHSIYLAKYSVH